MKEVTKEAFYEKIYKGNLNVHPYVVGKYPYTSIFKFSDGREFGRAVEAYLAGRNCGQVEEKYYIVD